VTVSVSCLCGGVRFTLATTVGEITGCHCTQCRKTSGHYAASFDVICEPAYTARATLAEYVTPKGASRGFCNACGSSLWFRNADGALSVEAGAVDGATGAQMTGHIFVADKGDYYALADGLVQAEGW